MDLTKELLSAALICFTYDAIASRSLTAAGLALIVVTLLLG